jgi:hypothetical protein
MKGTYIMSPIDGDIVVDVDEDDEGGECEQLTTHTSDKSHDSEGCHRMRCSWHRVIMFVVRTLVFMGILVGITFIVFLVNSIIDIVTTKNCHQ